ncbi:glycoside hydrolase family 88/105 protein [Neptunitalea lumnitzerae]|uniref:Glycosyl hydrolase family 88 n=1 Tax=Neptunitalea lumnitzerae TaxID=2965509 RepID=A0ABQ5MIW5_9FLAO|nr:glycoside hydrolase family 88 protein [Neptunitalea sp. Y10]GLB49333.1 glycosyl hydrolase family 88 [Neptunitalea sp. Y10]
MKKSFLIVACLLIYGFATAQSTEERRQKILADMILANEYFMKKWPDVGKTIITNKERASNIWTRAVYYEGLMELYKVYPDEAYYKYAYDWANFHKWGFRYGNTNRNADDYCAAQTYIELYKLEPKPEKLKNTRAALGKFLYTPENDDWSWIDAIQMGMPALAMMGVLEDNPAYFEKMYDMYMFTRNSHGKNGLFNTDDGLWWRDADFTPPYKEPNGEDCYWSRGNGWVIAALARVLTIIPENAPHRKQYEEDLVAMSEALIKVQRKDGLWNVSLHDDKHFGGKELTGTAMFVYGMAYGVNNGLLDKKKYEPIIWKAWNAMIEDCLHKNGFLGYVQSTGKEPKDGQPLSYDKIPDFEDYGLGAFLMAGAEVYRIE